MATQRMETARVTPRTVADAEAPGAPAPGRFAWAPVGVLITLLLLTTANRGAFTLRQWAPIAIVALIALAAGAAAGGLRMPTVPLRIAIAGAWGLVAWTGASAAWSESPAQALEATARLALYASLFTLPCVVGLSRRAAAYLGGYLVAGIGLIAMVTLGQLLADGPSQYLAGRLDDPIGYRNATACLFAVAVWPLVCAAARWSIPVPIRALALSAAALSLGLVFATQARGVVAALAAGGVIALGLGPERVRRAWTSMVPVLGVGLLSGRLLTPYDAFIDNGRTTSQDISTAVEALVVLAVGALIVGFVGALLDGGLRLTSQTRRRLHLLASAALAVAVVIAAAGALAATGNPVTYAKDRIEEFRDVDAAPAGGTRLVFAGGQRSDLWRIALDQFAEKPLAGSGAGSYQTAYYEQRRSDRNLSDPHSSVLAIAGELGLVGLLALALFVVGLAVAVLSGWRRASATLSWWSSALLAAGTVVLAQTAVDWLWLIPGVTGLGFLCLGVGVAMLDSASPRGLGRIARSTVAAGLTVLALVVTALYASDAYVRSSRADANVPRERLDEARTAESLNPFALPPHHLQAGALEDLGRPAEARRELLDALDLEPRNFVTMGLLGDLELRAGRPAAARTWYRRALQRNPRDVGLRELATAGTAPGAQPPG